jgi:hypothetical protein
VADCRTTRRIPLHRGREVTAKRTAVPRGLVGDGTGSRMGAYGGGGGGVFGDPVSAARRSRNSSREISPRT